MNDLNKSDLSLIKSVQMGNKHAFDFLVVKYQYKILKLIKYYIKDPNESMDIAQETFIKAYKALNNFRKESSFYTWLYKIAINTTKSYIIDKNRHLPDCSVDILETEQLDNIIKEHSKEFYTPDHLTICQELENIFFSVVDKLPEELKTTIKLREVDELTYEEIASIMECPVGTVRSRIFRAREAIEKKVSGQN